MEPQPFWMVKGAGPASALHCTRDAAEREAKRLAALHPGKPFFVMETVACYRKVDVERIDLSEAILAMADDEQQIPF